MKVHKSKQNLTIVNNNFIHFLQILYIFNFVKINSKCFCCISVSFEFHKFQSHNLKATVADKKANIIVTYWTLLTYTILQCVDLPKANTPAYFATA